MKRIPMISGDEYDILTAAHRDHRYPAGRCARVKRAYRRRERHQGRMTLADWMIYE